MLALDHVESADAGADMDADSLGVFIRDLQLRHLERFIRRSQREVDEAAHLLNFFFLDEVQRVKVADFGGDLARICGCVKGGNTVDAALSRQQRGPHLGGGVTERADHADAGNNDSACQITCLPWRACRCSPPRR